MAFSFSWLLPAIKAVSKTKTFELAAQLMFKKIGERIEASSNNPDEIKAIAKELVTEAPAIVGAVAKGTEAEHLVSAENIHQGGK